MTWRDCSLGDVITLKRGHDLPEKKRVPGPVPVVSSSGITGSHNVAKAAPPGVITGRYGTIGEVFYVDKPYWPHNTALYVTDYKGNDPRFVAYLLRNTLRNYKTEKAAVPGVDRNVLHTLKIRAPSVNEQAAIVSILSIFDDLIENNRRRIALLEKAARLLYREWFIHLRFPGHEHVKILDGLPNGWERCPLFDGADAIYGHAFKSELFNETEKGLPVVRIRDVPKGTSSTWTTEEGPADRRLANGDFLIGMDGDFHMNFWAGGEAWLNQRITKINSDGRMSVGLLRFALEGPIKRLNKTITGTTVKHLGAKHLKQIDLIMPSSGLLNQANEFFETTRDLVVNLNIQKLQLAQARDLLLPRLINGELALWRYHTKPPRQS